MFKNGSLGSEKEKTEFLIAEFLKKGNQQTNKTNNVYVY